MFRLMRNVHLILGLVFFFYALLFALSSLVIIYRPWLKPTTEDKQLTVMVPAERAQTPRALALELMENHGIKGELRDIQEDSDEFRFAIVRPGTQVKVTYLRQNGKAKIQTRREGFLNTLVSLHTNFGFRHDFTPSNGWS